MPNSKVFSQIREKISILLRLADTYSMIQRSEYLGRLAKWRDKQLVKVISGVRGSGKSTLLALYIDWLKRTGVDDKQIIFINMENPESESLLHYQGLYSFIAKRLCANKFTYIFIDEIQKCRDYQKALEGLLIKKQVDLYAAVSNSCRFSKTSYIEIKMLPLSFNEYLLFTRLRNKTMQIPGRAQELEDFTPNGSGRKNQAQEIFPVRKDKRLPRQKEQMEKFLRREDFNNYISFGGFPFTAALSGDASMIRQCVEGIYNTVLVKDISWQSGISDIPLLENISKLMGQSAGRPISSKKISVDIDAKGRKISTNTVEAYMRALCSAFVFYHAERFDIKTGQHLKTLGKHYIADTGIRNLLMDQESPDVAGLLENIVYMELLRRDCRVSVGKFGGEEVNFIAQNASALNTPDKKAAEYAYYQVAASAREGSIHAKKISPLEKIKDDSPKYLLSLDETPFRSNHKGIIQRNLIEWLLETNSQA
jgi:predicted AAA+ superfamily ATPase